MGAIAVLPSGLAGMSVLRRLRPKVLSADTIVGSTAVFWLFACATAGGNDEGATPPGTPPPESEPFSPEPFAIEPPPPQPASKIITASDAPIAASTAPCRVVPSDISASPQHFQSRV